MLDDLAHMSLKQRVVFLNTSWSIDPPLTVYKLRLIYRKHKVRLKQLGKNRSWRRPDDAVNIAKDEVVFAQL